ncbi:hypothetical protein F4V44_10955 [Niallia endozanthoxylica]|uniref:Helix-hairpin-helix DNA-binding motif class 1 domain-containing protein n=1 Tax=Niallia endozanthoxylica TaxID=2036016 RepID=A0A5J5HXS7_9BACI|nr:hypothetical protein F4V44_10955 [Niallia endozanthoxylica]
MIDWLKGNKMYLLIATLVVLTIVIYFLVPSEKNLSNKAVNSDWMEIEDKGLLEDEQEETEIEGITEEKERILIDVKGAVAAPGVYEALSGDRVQNLINQAGGLLETADQQKINFAMKVVDEMVLYIPMIGEDSQVTAGGQGSIPAADAVQGKALVNLNTASESELETLPGVGPSKAAAIMEYRETNGRFQNIEELMEISGIGEKTFEKLKEHISVN